MLMITSSPAPDSASSVTSVCRLSYHRPTTFALSRTFVHAVRKVVTGWDGIVQLPLPGGEDNHSGLHSPNLLRRKDQHALIFVLEEFGDSNRLVANQPLSDGCRIIAPAQPDYLGRRSEIRGEFVEIRICRHDCEPARLCVLPNEDVRIL